MAVLDGYMTPMPGNESAVPPFAQYMQLIQQGHQVPPDQAQINQAVMSQGPATPPPEPTIHDVPMVENFRPGQGLQAYMPPATRAADRALIDQYRSQSKDSMNQQQMGIDQLEQMRKDLAGKNLTPDLSALSALADTMNGAFGHKTDLARTAVETRGMTPDQRDAAVVALQEKIQGAKGDMSKQNLSATKDVLQMIHQNDQANLMAQHYANEERAQSTKANSFADRVELMKDAQAKSISDAFDNDKIIKPQMDRLNQIKLDRHTLESGGVITKQVMDEISMGVANALGGGKGSSLSAQEKQELNTLQSDLAKNRAYLSGEPVNAISPANKEFLVKMLNRIEQGYGNSIARRSDQLASGRAYHANPYAQKMLEIKHGDYRSFGSPGYDTASGYANSKPPIPSDTDLEKMTPAERLQLLEAYK